MKKTKGITLIALVITIIIILILVGVTISISIQSGLFGYAKKAVKETEQSVVAETIQSILPGYYIETMNDGKNLSLKEYLVAMLDEDATGFMYDCPVKQYNNTQEDTSVLYFNCKVGKNYYGFSINSDNLELKFLDNPIKIFQLVNNMDNLEVGKQYLIATEVNQYGKVENSSLILDELNITSSSANRISKCYVVNNGMIAYNGKYALTLGGEPGNYTFYDSTNNGYLNVSSGIKNYLGVRDKIDAYSKFSIAFSGDAAIITNTGKNTNNVIQYNNNSNTWLISAYNYGTQKDVYLYKECGQAAPNLLATPNVKVEVSDSKVKLVWDEVEGATSYTVSWASEADKGSNNYKKQPTTECQMEINGLTNGTRYYYQVRANSSTPDRQNSAWTSEESFIPTIGKYVLVNSLEELTSGARYIMVAENNGEYFVLDADNGNNRKATKILAKNNEIEYNGDYSIKIEKTNDNTYTLKDLYNNAYLNATSSTSKNYLKTIETLDKYSYFSIDFRDADGTATIINTGKETRNIVKFNVTSSLFACYNLDINGTKNVYLYKEQT